MANLRGLADGQSKRDRRQKRDRQRRELKQARRYLAQADYRATAGLEFRPLLRRCRQCGQVYLSTTSAHPTRCAPCGLTIFLPAWRTARGSGPHGHDGTPAA